MMVGRWCRRVGHLHSRLKNSQFRNRQFRNCGRRPKTTTMIHRSLLSVLRQNDGAESTESSLNGIEKQWQWLLPICAPINAEPSGQYPLPLVSLRLQSTVCIERIKSSDESPTDYVQHLPNTTSFYACYMPQIELVG